MKGGFHHDMIWRVPCSTKKWKGQAENVMSVVTNLTNKVVHIDIRVRRTVEHHKGEGYTREGVRLNLEDASLLAKAIQHALRELEEGEDD